MEVLGKIDGEKAAWGRLRHHPDRRPVPGVVVVRLDAPLFWANASAFEDRLLAEVDRRPDTRALVLDLEATTQLDTTSADVLTHLAAELEARHVSVYLARVLHGVGSVLHRSGFGEVVGPDRFWHSISQCVRAARRDTGLKGAGTGAHAAMVEGGPLHDDVGTFDNGDAEVHDVFVWDDEKEMIDGDPGDPATS